MKRNTYKISIDGKQVATKSAWNSALREMRNQIRKVIPEGTAEITSKEFTIGVRGDFVWSADRDYKVRIEKLENK